MRKQRNKKEDQNQEPVVDTVQTNAVSEVQTETVSEVQTEGEAEAEVLTEGEVLTEAEPEPEAKVVKTLQIVYKGTPTNEEGEIEIITVKDFKQAIVFFNFGKDLDEMVEKFSNEVTFTNARSKMKIGLQALIRAYLKGNKDIKTLMDAYKPGVSMERAPVNMELATENYFKGLSAEEQEMLIKKLMGK